MAGGRALRLDLPQYRLGLGETLQEVAKQQVRNNYNKQTNNNNNNNSKSNHTTSNPHS